MNKKEAMDILHEKVNKYIDIKDLEENDYICSIHDFTHKALDLAPDYFWTRMASTSGKHHKSETLVEHVLECLAFGKHIVYQMTEGYYGEIWGSVDVACFYSALILHDIFASGPSGQEKMREDCSLSTDPFHMIYPQYLLKDIKLKNIGLRCNRKPKDYAWFTKITEAILYHYGPWNPITVLDMRNLKCTDIRYQVFNVDFVVSRRNVKIVSS